MTRCDLVVTRQGARFLGRRFACAIGRGGLSDDKREGDGATPRGRHRIVGLLYRPDRLSAAALPRRARAIRRFDLWSDDPTDPCYNRPVRAPHPYSAETLRRADPLYDLILLTDWNSQPAVAGRGSAIFLHCWRRPRFPTAGCVAFRHEDLLWIARRLRPWSRLVIR